MKNCKQDKKNCSNSVIVEDYYDINLGTRYERKYYKFVTNLAMEVDKSFNSKDFEFGNSSKTRGIDGYQTTTPKKTRVERILSWKNTMGSKGVIQAFNKNVHHLVNADEKGKTHY